MPRFLPLVFLFVSAQFVWAETSHLYKLSQILSGLKNSNRILPKEFETSGFNAELGELLNKYYRTLGGFDRWSEVESFLIHGVVHFPGSGSLQFKNYRMKPDLNKLVLYLPKGYKLVLCFNGLDAWQLHTFVSPEPNLMPVEQSIDFIRDACFGGHLLYPKLEGKELTLLDNDVADESTHRDIEVVLPNGQNIIYSLSTLGYLIAEETKSMQSGISKRVEMSEFKRISGVAIPFEGKTYFDGELVQEVRIESVKLNHGVYAWMFEM